MSDENDFLEPELRSLLEDASVSKIIKDQPKLIKPAEMTSAEVSEIREKVTKMQGDGFSAEQIALALGYDPTTIAWLLTEKEDIGSPEQILQESLRTLLALVPIADATYRRNPSQSSALALVSFITSAREIVADRTALKDKEETYRAILQKVLQPFVRQMISDIMSEFKHMTTKLDDSADIDRISAELKTVATNLGKKMEEAYRKGTEGLADSLSVTGDAKTRVLVTTGLAGTS